MICKGNVARSNDARRSPDIIVEQTWLTKGPYAVVATNNEVLPDLSPLRGSTTGAVAPAYSIWSPIPRVQRAYGGKNMVTSTKGHSAKFAAAVALWAPCRLQTQIPDSGHRIPVRNCLVGPVPTLLTVIVTLSHKVCQEISFD